MKIYCDGATTKVCFIPEGCRPFVYYLRHKKTNNEGEYTAVLYALLWAKTQREKQVEILSDSELIVKQLAGEYALKNPRLRDLAQQVWHAAQNMTVSYRWIPREENPAGKVSMSAGSAGTRRFGAPNPWSYPSRMVHPGPV